ncbi:hypothetical protein B0A58_02805 [Flavobacterium branchiophilum NBRC 15030 = ATCC 35035]|uniref:HNH endonuclease n=1 Tax=Flavobacterium branchiophilum TaxID=55197 RepID=A0A543G286_9FLAO|nr:hypothetical protein [Flavobacterium branchiophilum]OXA80108.1 hypothetical protein B0A58_02805 [Flavobacterium branchiophilum NBRC 15030 = ATCC 35035]TQM40155.1 hypothetical protein BC670_1025 [Flavobacterium branchiophilum]GEM54932.1 hypothetical protein FB1_11530 [Flavobacterium branchiophilum NBRC 15030 = ATCC 35035]
MLSINFGTETKEICETYCDGIKSEKRKGMVDWVFEKKEKLFKEAKALNENGNLKEKLENLEKQLTKEKINTILSCNIQELKTINEEYKEYKEIKVKIKKKSDRHETNTDKYIEKHVLNFIFNYDSFRKQSKDRINGYWLSEQLGIQCCPYCNRNYTTSHQTYYKNKNGNSEKKFVFPEFDHFYPKKNYPLTALSFYNLIPSCNICNTHFKNDRDPAEIFHPYTKVENNHFNFKGFPNDVATLYGADNKITLDFDYNSSKDEINKQIEKSIEFFGIKDIYEKCHSDLIKEIIHKKLAFSDTYINILQSTYNIGFEEAYRILFEVYFEDDKLHKRPFSKLKKDILKELGINIK